AAEEACVERLGTLRCGCLRERRPPTLAAVGVERELGHDEQLALHLVERVGEAAGIVVEDAEPDDLPAERVGVGLRIGMTDADQYAETAPDLPRRPAVDGHTSLPAP